MAINIDHTSALNLTLKGPDNVAPNTNRTIVFPISDSPTATLLVSGEATISSISGLSSALSLKLDASLTGNIATFNTGIFSGQIPVLNEYGKIEESLIPSIAIKDVFIVDNYSEITGLNGACIGDTAIATGSKCNFVLSCSGVGAYSILSNWKPISFKDQIVTSVNGDIGDVCLDSTTIYVTDATNAYVNCNVDEAVKSIYESKAPLSALINYATQSYLSNCTACYETCTGLDSKLSNYTLCTDFNSILSGYSTTLEISGCLENYYVNKSVTGSAASRNVGTGVGCIVEVASNGKICDALIPALAIKDTFFVTETGELIGLTNADKGDLAIVTGECKNNFILGIQGGYADINNWYALAVPLAPIESINGVYPVSGALCLTAQDIPITSLCYNLSAYDFLTGASGLAQQVANDYVTQACAFSLLSGYIPTGCLSQKSNTGHIHCFCDITFLEDCLNSISAFISLENNNSAVQRTSNYNLNTACSNYALLLGLGGCATQDYEVVHSAGVISNGTVGDAQSSKLIFKCVTSTSPLQKIAEICIGENQSAFYDVSLIGKTPCSTAAFGLKGMIQKCTSTSSIVNGNLEIFANENDLYHATALPSGTSGNLAIYISGDSNCEMRWLINASVLKIKGSN
jgi:hypothetical protein